MKNKNVFLIISFLIFSLSVVGVYVWAAKPNPGHQWNEIGCEEGNCNLRVDKNGNITSSLNFKIDDLNSSIGINRSGFYIKANNENIINVDDKYFTVYHQVKLKGIDSSEKIGVLQVDCSQGKCYAVFAPPE